MSPDATALLARTTIVVHTGPFLLAAWPRDRLDDVAAVLATPAPTDPGARPAGPARARGRSPEQAAFLLVDDREVTAAIHASRLEELPPPEQVEGDFCLLTLDTVMPWDVVGVLAKVTAALARAGVPVGAFSAFSRDHLLVPAPRLAAALDALRPLCAGVDVRDG